MHVSDEFSEFLSETRFFFRIKKQEKYEGSRQAMVRLETPAPPPPWLRSDIIRNWGRGRYYPVMLQCKVFPVHWAFQKYKNRGSMFCC